MTGPSEQGPRDNGASPNVVLVTGPSGAGRTTAIRVLEDTGFEVIDNLPLSLIPRLLSGGALSHPIALGVDVRNRDFSTQAMIDLIDGHEATHGRRLELLYLDCGREVLLNRYSETRRRHPLAPAESPAAGISREIELLQPIKARADVLIDTTEMTVHDLKGQLLGWYAAESGGGLSVAVQSFSYKRGIPRGLDLVFDVRFLRNPHWEEALRGFTGQSDAVQAYIAEDERYQPFIDKTFDLIEFVLPAYREEGKSHIGIGFGCTGGKHRSVALTETLSKALADKGWQVSIRHRELERAEGRS